MHCEDAGKGTRAAERTGIEDPRVLFGMPAPPNILSVGLGKALNPLKPVGTFLL